MLNLIKKELKFLILITAILVVFGLGFVFGKNSIVCEVCPPSNVNLSLLWEAWDIIEKKYIDSGEINREKMIYGAISGITESLEDAYTVFFDPDETKRFLENVSGQFEGVGIEIGIREGQLQVIAPLEGTPAQKAGLRPGDKIIKINNELTTDMTIEEVITLIRGPKGTYVTLTISRDDWQNTKEFRIKRAVINVPSLKWELLEDNIAYIKIYHFSENADIDFQRAGLKILKTSADRLIIDLRNNPGGYLEISQKISGWFLKKEDIVVIEDFGDKKEQKEYLAKGNSWFLSYPIIILINEGSASASEILAAALKDNRDDVKIVGKTSFGKGSVQELVNLSDNSSLKITIADWLTPKGSFITDVGLNPDFEVEMTEEDYDKEQDPQLNKAIEIVKGMK